MAKRAKALRYAVRLPVLAKYLGQLFFVIVLLMAVPALVCLLYGDVAEALGFLAVIVLLTACGWAANRLPHTDRIQTNEALVLTAAAFLIASLCVVVPFMQFGMSAMDAFFEAVSGITTTGLTMLGDVSAAPAGLLFCRAWLQWIGGLGIVIISLVLIFPSGALAKDIGETEAIQDDLLGGVKTFARQVLLIYLFLTLTGVVLLTALGVSFTDALLYTFAAVSTGGFAPDTASAAGLQSVPAQVAVLVLAFSGALPMLVYIRLRQRSPIHRRETAQILGILFSAILVAGIMILDNALNRSRASSVSPYDLSWMAMSAQTTAGFSTLSAEHLGSASKIALMMAMSIGGGIGSTAGGFKIYHLLAVLHLMRTMVSRTQLTPHAVLPVRFFGNPLDPPQSHKLLLIPLLFAAVVGISWLIFGLHGYPALDSLFDVVSATGTVGLSTGTASHRLPALLKLVLCADMLMGRLEFIAWLVVLSPNTWIGRRL